MPSAFTTPFTCVTVCPGTHILTADEASCRLLADGCADGEYKDGSVCKYCTSANLFIECDKCTSSECTKCKTNYFRNFNNKKVCLENCADASLYKRALTDECVTECKTDDSSYLSVDGKNCVASCTGNLGTTFKTSFDLKQCIYPLGSCGSATLFADSSNNYVCSLCNTALSNCEECTSSTVCTKCSAATKLV